MFEGIVRDAAARYGLRDHAGDLLSGLLDEVFRRRVDGLSGLFDAAGSCGLAHEVASWIGSAGVPLNIGSAQLDNLLGPAIADRLARATGLPRQAVASALAYMLPRVVRIVTAAGRIPRGIPVEVAELLTGAATPPVSVAPASGGPGPPPAGKDEGTPAWLWLLLLLPLVLVMGWWALRTPSRPAESPAPRAEAPAPPAESRGTTAPAPAAEAPAPAATANPRLRVANDAGKIVYAGSVADETTRAAIVQALVTGLGDAATGNIAIDVAARPALWAGRLATVVPDLKVPGTRLTFDGDTVTLEGSLTQAAIDGMAARLRTALGGSLVFVSKADVVPAPPPAERDNAKAAAALEEVRQAGAKDPKALIDALNLEAVQFGMGSADLSAESVGVLGKAAEAILAAPPGTRIEIGGHTDNIGPPQRNLQLSRERANAVRAVLVERGVPANRLEARGYGSARPIAANNTYAGRQRNRRMEFRLLP